MIFTLTCFITNRTHSHASRKSRNFWMWLHSFASHFSFFNRGIKHYDTWRKDFISLIVNGLVEQKLKFQQVTQTRTGASFPPLHEKNEINKLASHSRLSFLKNSSFSNLLRWSGTTRGILNVVMWSIFGCFICLREREMRCRETPPNPALISFRLLCLMEWVTV